MRWLQWATCDLANGLGGVEVHARRLAQELQSLGIESALSNDPQELLNPKWDVIHTHGSLVPQWPIKTTQNAIRVLTLHGSTWERMKACHEYTWPGGYLAYGRELAGIRRADIVLSVRENLSLFKMAVKLGKKGVVCSNGWDSFNPALSIRLPVDLENQIANVRPFLFFIGRGSDPVKATDILVKALELNPTLRLVTAPGEGFAPHHSQIFPTGRLSPSEIIGVLRFAQAMILPSRYEGNSLAILESLATGVPVIATNVGGTPYYPKGIQGLVKVEKLTPLDLYRAIETAHSIPSDLNSKNQRALNNRALLSTWKNVAEKSLRAVEEFRSARSQKSSHPKS